jgi:hypothetical protein
MGFQEQQDKLLQNSFQYQLHNQKTFGYEDAVDL